MTSVLRHPFLVALCLALGLALGVGTALAMPATHTAEARVAVVPADSNAYTVAGYPVGAQSLAADYARWVQNRATDGSWAPAGTSKVSASPIPDSAVIRIEVESQDRDAAVAGAEQVANTLISTVAGARSGHDPESAYKEFQSIAPKVAAARGDVSEAERVYALARGADARERASEALQKAQVALAELQLKQDAAGELYRKLFVDVAGNSTLKVVAPPAVQGDAARSGLIRYGIVGLGAGALLGLLLAVLVDRRRAGRARRRVEDPGVG